MIGVFDSGIGGLTVVRALRKKLPGVRITYVGDVARMPYGNKSAATVLEYSREITRYLIRRGAKMIVVACNTASTIAPRLRKEFKVPIIDVIAPAARTALQSGATRIAVLGTRATIMSGAYKTSLRAKRSNLVTVFPLACPMFVPIVEEGLVGTKEGAGIVRRTLQPLKNKKIEVAILGCTHYPLLRHEIARALPGVRLIDSSAVAADVKAFVQGDPKLGKKGPLEILVTDKTPHFERFARKIIGPAKLTVLPVERLMK
jgi:glutamate racemase